MGTIQWIPSDHRVVCRQKGAFHTQARALYKPSAVCERQREAKSSLEIGIGQCIRFNIAAERIFFSLHSQICRRSPRLLYNVCASQSTVHGGLLFLIVCSGQRTALVCSFPLCLCNGAQWLGTGCVQSYSPLSPSICFTLALARTLPSAAFYCCVFSVCVRPRVWLL